jgi:hypothetical protein
MQHRHLVIARVGQNSLHPTWLGDPATRNWDLYLCPFQALLPQAAAQATLGEVIVGPKWTGLRELLNAWPGWRDYDYVWLPDDDIFASQDTITRMFETAAALKFDLCAPALHEASYYAHFTTMRNRNTFARMTGFVEIMVPCFSTRALDVLLPTLDLTTTGWGWGLDSLWPKLLEYRNTGIIDGTPVLHTRPVGAFRDAELGQRVMDESDRIMHVHECRQVHTTWSAFGPDLQPLGLVEDELTVKLLDGWRYLLDGSPSLVRWIVAAQYPSIVARDYPVAGLPASGAAF